jgi:UDP-N-acetylmuramate dehydrogenase
MPADSDAVPIALEALASLGDRVVRRGALGRLTTYRVGGRAAILVTVATRADLVAVSRASSLSGLATLVVGRGSNLLVSDCGFAGIAVVLDPTGFGAVEVDGTTVKAGAAVALPTLARQTVEAGLTGFEWAVGVPGSVGGAVRMNAGGHGSDMSSCVLACDLVNLSGGGRPIRRRLGEMDYGYRRSSVGPDEVVTAVELGLSPGDRDTGLVTIREIIRWRREHQPGGQNAGSVFANPPGDSAGRLIEAAGLKGRRIGTAEVSAKHANFIQADAGGSAEDVRSLIEAVGREVEAREGVHLETEVKMIGFSDNRGLGALQRGDGQ